MWLVLRLVRAERTGNRKSVQSLHYIETGPAASRAVVFLHGFLGTLDDWSETSGCLGGAFRCIRVDLPGHGGSIGLRDPEEYTFRGACSAVCDLAEGLSLRDPILVGYSMGGRLALSLAVFSGFFRAAAIVSATAGFRKDGEREARAVADLALAGRIRSEPLPQFLRAWYGQPLFRELASQPDLLEEVLHRRAGGDPLELARAMEGMSVGVQPPCWDGLAGSGLPLLFAAGERDSRYAQFAAEMAAAAPSGQLKIFSGCGHALHLEQPRAFAACLGEFVNSLPG